MKDTMKSLKERVRTGANFLRTLDPKWFLKINPETIDLDCPKNCLLGQFSGDYCAFSNKLMTDYPDFWNHYFPSSLDNQWAKHGFDLSWDHDKEDKAALTDIWKKTITKFKTENEVEHAKRTEILN